MDEYLNPPTFLATLALAGPLAYPVAFWMIVEDILSVYPHKESQRKFVRVLLTPRSEILTRMIGVSAFLILASLFFRDPSPLSLTIKVILFVLLVTTFHLFLRSHYLDRIRTSLMKREKLYQVLGEEEFEKATRECLEVVQNWRTKARVEK